MGDASVSKVASLECGHYMCRSCLERIFRLSISDPQHMPPRCCTQKHIPLRHVERLFDRTFKRTWNRKFAEFSTKNRLYCPGSKCGEWIKPADIHREKGQMVARCSRCKLKVCGQCNAKWHGGAECPADDQTARLLALAQEEGWKRCYRCRALVELREGCNHMTCRCGAEFCMACGVKWNRCECPWFDGGGFLGEMGDGADISVPQIRGDLGDIFRGDGPRRRSHDDQAILVRRIPASWEREALLQQRALRTGGDKGDDELISGVGHVYGVGNAAGHLMNDDYRSGGGRYRKPPLARVLMVEGKRESSNEGHRGRDRRAGSMEQRLADRLSKARPGPAGPAGPAGPGPGLGIQVRTVPLPKAASLVDRRDEETQSRQRRNTERTELLAGRGQTSSSSHGTVLEAPAAAGRVEGTRSGSELSRGSGPTRPADGRREVFLEPHRSSEMAGLGRAEQGGNRVSQWRSFVEPGVPDGESVIGHAA